MSSPSWIVLAALVAAGGGAKPGAKAGAPEAKGGEALPEFVIIAPEVVDLKPALGQDAWKAAVAELEKQRAELGVSTKLQKSAKAALAGPARDQAAECRLEPPCLAELGATLGAGFLVVGTVEKESVSWLIIDVLNKKKILAARSTKKLAPQGTKKQAEASTKAAFNAFKDWRAGKRPEGEVGSVAVTGGSSDPLLKPGEAAIRIDAKELASVDRVEIDGIPVPRQPDGHLLWIGQPGRHEVLAMHQDRSRARHDLALEAGRTVELVLVFLEAAPPPPPPPPPPPLVVTSPPPPRDDGTVTNKWWFWVAAGGAVVAGGTAAALLAGGTKGGPQVGSSVGSISGSY